MKKLTILIDMDDTIENLKEVWVEAVNERYGYHTVADSLTDWDIALGFPGLPKETVYSIILEPWLYDRLRPFPGAPEALQRLSDDGHELYIVTSTNFEIVPEKMRFLFKYFPCLDWGHVILSHHKQMIRGDVLVDDGIHNLVDGAYHKILYSAAHNRLYDAEANGMVRVENWEEAYAAIKALAEAE